MREVDAHGGGQRSSDSGKASLSASEREWKMSCPQAELEEKERPLSEELECKICYQRYNAHNRRPKLLDCLHRMCTRCLVKILYVADGTGFICCPFCRHQTQIGEYDVSALPDDANIMSRLRLRDKSWSLDHNQEVVLSPKSFFSSSPSRDTSNCLFITIMDVQREPQRLPSHNSSSDVERNVESLSAASNGQADQDSLSKFCNHVPRILVWLLGFLYFGSLPLGIYLLVIQRVTLGIVCVSLVPSSLTVCLVYGFCQCLCQGMCDCSSRG
ncbi:E3 ubiquitin-protein ligase RNF182 isoform X1 [Syngnathus acus]|uniref:E3 ubiquitin-protein ligase RNF182 isoform X1 n=1 Tax=Syngnathus acus TaxID=161584 RepID=UPI00188649A5|nr:E3 ubiquitin-protein ligase RNF182 isoform X1 [Syngnathus acus]